MVDATPRPFTFGELLDGAFTLYRRNFVVFFGAALLPQIPLVLWGLLSPAWTATSLDDPLLGDPATLLIMPYNLFASFLVLGALTYAVGSVYAGDQPTIGDALRRGLRRWIPVAVAGLCAGFLVMLGLFFFLVPGLVLMTLFFAIAPAAVLEERGPIEAMGRSRRISKGGRPRIFGVLFVAWLITFLPTFAMWIIAGIAAGATGAVTGEGAGALASTWFMALVQAGSPVVSALTWPFFIAVTVLLYFDRRARVEAPDLEAAAARLQPEG